jgi:hypothetical protein
MAKKAYAATGLVVAALGGALLMSSPASAGGFPSGGGDVNTNTNNIENANTSTNTNTNNNTASVPAGLLAGVL